MKVLEARIAWSSVALLAVALAGACAPGGATEAGEGGADIVVLPAGEAVDLLAHASPGKVTIYDFYADWCAPCKIIAPQLEQLARNQPDRVALRQVDVIDWQSKAATHQGIEFLPYLAVVGADGQVATEGDASFGYIKEEFGVDLMSTMIL